MPQVCSHHPVMIETLTKVLILQTSEIVFMPDGLVHISAGY